jgi:drug/metabolite transporter (DMT)-like permease
MVELWVPITIGAVVFQTIRTGLQKHLKAELTTSAVTYVRFLFGMPLAALFLALTLRIDGQAMPPVSGWFLFYVFLGGAGQILGTFLLVHLFSFRNFAVGTTYTKTEAIQTALIGLLFFGQTISAAGFLAIVVSAVGVMMISIVHGHATLRGFLTGWTNRIAVYGVVAGTGFAVAAVGVRAASLSLHMDGFLVPASLTLLWVTGMQVVAMTVYMVLRERRQLVAIVRNAKFSALVGLTGVLGSICWFNAMTLENAAYVRTLGQVELILSLLTSYVVFKERSTRYEIVGMVMIGIGIVILLLFR